MNGHLSSEQIAQWMIGDRSSGEQEHVLGCARCAAEVSRLESAVTLFRGSVRERSEANASPNLALLPTAEPREFLVRSWRWAPVTAAILLLSLIPVYNGARDHQHKAQIARDAALLEQVDAEVSRSVPASLEPLVSLVAWGQIPPTK